MDNIIKITLNDKEHIHRIEMDSSPTPSELVAAVLVLWEVLEHNFDRQTILNKIPIIYSRLYDLEEVVIGGGNE